MLDAKLFCLINFVKVQIGNAFHLTKNVVDIDRLGILFLFMKEKKYANLYLHVMIDQK